MHVFLSSGTNKSVINFTILSFVILIIKIFYYISLTSMSEWIIVYWFIFGSYLVCGLFYMLCLSTELQPWNEITEKPLQEDVKDIQEIESLQKDDSQTVKL
ncbi:hypothetical protein Anas_06761 [Armadillidium nasatum]|uniref:Uncharacterized protein n=1 Tax=Armadillidium nasatum TaxID=96803 RepID=A0A5N5STK8_9CRUS|nr:hypothetical protein Anas_06761 [Armadillidium nasatum]